MKNILIIIPFVLINYTLSLGQCGNFSIIDPTDQYICPGGDATFTIRNLPRPTTGNLSPIISFSVQEGNGTTWSIIDLSSNNIIVSRTDDQISVAIKSVNVTSIFRFKILIFCSTPGAFASKEYYSKPFKAIITPKVTFITSPKDVTACLQSSVSFEVKAQSIPGKKLFYQWQENNNGVWSNLSDAGSIKGTQTTIFTINNLSNKDIAREYRCAVYDNCKSTETTGISNSVKIISKSADIEFDKSIVNPQGVINACVNDKVINLSDLPSIKGGDWVTIIGTGMTKSTDQITFTPNDVSYTTSRPNTFRYTVKNNNCIYSKNLQIYVKNNKEIPTLLGAPNDIVCPKQQFNLTAKINSSLPYNFIWRKKGSNTNLSATNQFLYTASESETLELYSVNTFGCKSDPATAIINTAFKNGAIVLSKEEANVGEKIIFDVTNEPDDYMYTWDFGDGTLEAKEKNPTHSFNKTGEFNVMVTIKATNSSTCEIEKSVKIKVKKEESTDVITSDPVSTDVITGDLVSTDAKGVSIFPNPVSEKLSIDSKQQLLFVQLTDFNGSLVYKKPTLGKNDIDIDVSALAAGLYNLQLIFDSKVETKKIMIKH